jgi:outer membrane protein assembly factor BamB
MQRMVARIGGGILGLLLLGFVQPVQAVIQRLTPLKEVLAESQLIFTVKVDSVDADKPAFVLTVDEQLKGKTAFEKMSVNLSGDSEAKKDKQTAALLKRVAPKMSLVVFALQQDKKYTAFAYSNGTWFQMIGETDGATVRWSFTHCEPYLRRTFKGSTADLRQIVVDGLAEKKDPPDPDPKVKPGLGPEVEEKAPDQDREEAKKERSERTEKRSAPPFHPPSASAGPLFAVIPSVAIGSAMAVLAALFPAVFGGLLVVMRRWMMVLTVASTNSTLYLLYAWLGHHIEDKWWGSPSALWLVMTAITLLCTLGAWRRNLAAVQLAGAIEEEPRRIEKVALWSLSLLGLVACAYYLWSKPSLADLSWKLVLVFSIGMWTGALSLLCRRIKARPRLATEGLVLWAMVVASTGLAASWPTPPAGVAQASEEEGVASVGGARVAHLVGSPLWNVVLPGSGSLDSSPVIDGDRIYVAAAHAGSVFVKPTGEVFCLNRATREILWRYNNDGAMKQVFSTPCVADGRLYIGEGFHEDRDCNLYCLDAATGRRLWAFPTRSHTESSPCVANGRVFFGAGDDGVYCVDATSGALVWHFESQIHVDANPTVVGRYLFAGSGVGDAYGKLEVFCLDMDTGKPLWEVPVDLPAWGAVTVDGDQIFVGLGNGNFAFSDEHPAGAMLCLEAVTGKQLWRFQEIQDSVLVRPVVDGRRVYFASRDQHGYCVDRTDGRLIWKQDLGSPIVSSPVLARCTCCAGSTSLYLTATGGKVCCLDPATGKIQWTFDVSQNAPELYATPALIVSRGPEGDQRRIYFGATLLGRTVLVLYCLEDHFTP